jgi:hypothetical protein
VTRLASALAAAILAMPALAAERLGVVAVGDPPAGPDPEITELAHQLRAACRDRVGGVEEVSTMRARLTGQLSGATLSELDRAYGGALAVYQNGEFESAFRTLRAIVDDLEGLPETDDVYYQWTRAVVRLAHAANTLERKKELEAAFAKLAATDVTFQPDADQYAPSFRKKYDDVRARVRALPRVRLTVLAEGQPGTVYLNGRNMGTAPLSLTLPVGTYRVGGAAGPLRVPTFTVDLQAEDRTVILDLALAESLRLNAGPGLALPGGQRAYGIIRAGAWLGVDRLVVASRVQEGQAQFLVGSMYDVRRGALLREGSVRMVAGSVPSVNLAALASFLLTGQSSREVKDRTGEGPREVSPPVVALAPLPAAPALEAPAIQAPVQVAPASPPPRVPVSVAPPAASLTAASTPTATPTPPSPTKPVTVAAKPPAPASTSAKPPDPRPSPAAAAAISAAPSLAAAAPASKPATAPGTSTHPAALALLAPPPVDQKPSLDIVPPPPSPAAARTAATTPSRASPAGWKKPVAVGSAVLAVGFTALAVQQGATASTAYADAGAMVLSNGSFRTGYSRATYDARQADGDAAMRNTYVSAGAAVVFGAAAVYFGWNAWGAGDGGTVGGSF